MSSKYQDVRMKWFEEKGFNLLADVHQHSYVQSLLTPPDAIRGVFCDSPAGTGKTALAVLAGAYGIENGDYDRIIYIRNTEVVGKPVGFLPGDLDGKIAPHMKPFVQALDHVKPGTYEKWAEEGKVHAITTTYERGVTYDRAFVILDEAQNESLAEFQTINTRPTDSCKIVTIGSLRQIDDSKMVRYYGYTPFELFMLHYKGQKTSYHELVTNYRGEWSLHADRIQDTLDKLRKESGK